MTPAFPRLYHTKRGALAWLIANNPHPEGSYKALAFESDFWGDQAERASRAAIRCLIFSGVCISVSLIATIIEAVIS